MAVISLPSDRGSPYVIADSWGPRKIKGLRNARYPGTYVLIPYRVGVTLDRLLAEHNHGLVQTSQLPKILPHLQEEFSRYVMNLSVNTWEGRPSNGYFSLAEFNGKIGAVGVAVGFEPIRAGANGRTLEMGISGELILSYPTQRAPAQQQTCEFLITDTHAKYAASPIEQALLGLGTAKLMDPTKGYSSDHLWFADFIPYFGKTSSITTGNYLQSSIMALISGAKFNNNMHLPLSAWDPRLCYMGDYDDTYELIFTCFDPTKERMERAAMLLEKFSFFIRQQDVQLTLLDSVIMQFNIEQNKKICDSINATLGEKAMGYLRERRPLNQALFAIDHNIEDLNSMIGSLRDMLPRELHNLYKTLGPQEETLVHDRPL